MQVSLRDRGLLTFERVYAAAFQNVLSQIPDTVLRIVFAYIYEPLPVGFPRLGTGLWTPLPVVWPDVDVLTLAGEWRRGRIGHVSFDTSHSWQPDEIGITVTSVPQSLSDDELDVTDACYISMAVTSARVCQPTRPEHGATGFVHSLLAAPELQQARQTAAYRRSWSYVADWLGCCWCACALLEQVVFALLALATVGVTLWNLFANRAELVLHEWVFNILFCCTAAVSWPAQVLVSGYRCKNLASAPRSRRRGRRLVLFTYGIWLPCLVALTVLYSTSSTHRTWTTTCLLVLQWLCFPCGLCLLL